MLPQDAINQKLVRTNNNMDAVRYILALVVVIAHYNELAGTNLPIYITSDAAVGAFFTLSGFLTFHSYYRRPDLRRFLAHRARRILPPYFLIVLLCALGLVFVSSLTASEYFLSAQWWEYLGANLSFMNFMQPALPGVFEGGDMLYNSVNGSLWTMKVEWLLYLSVPAVSWLIYRLHKISKARDMVIWLIILVSLTYRIAFMLLYERTGHGIYQIISRQFFGQLSFFYVGALIRIYLGRLLNYKTLTAILLGAGWVIMNLNDSSYIILGPFVYGGLALWLSMVGRWGKYISRHDNVSYDIYLFHFPIIQLAVWFGVRQHHPLIGFSIVTLITFAAAFASWNLIGRRFLR